MTTVTPLRRAAGQMPLSEATRRFLRRDAFEESTRVSYGRTLAALAGVVDAEGDVAAVTTEQLEDDLLPRWDHVAATTYNRHRAALLSFFGWCAQRGWGPAVNPAALIEPRELRKRTEAERRERPISRELLAELWTLDGVAGPDRTLWRMGYETWARAEELLGLNIEDLDLGEREGIVTGKGGDRETVWWATGTARLLPRVITGRDRGRCPRRPPADPADARGRRRPAHRPRPVVLRQAERLFTEAGQRLDPHGPTWTFHRLRHAGIAHAVEHGYSVAAIRAKSRHSSLRSLQVYANPRRRDPRDDRRPLRDRPPAPRPGMTGQAQALAALVAPHADP